MSVACSNETSSLGIINLNFIYFHVSCNVILLFILFTNVKTILSSQGLYCYRERHHGLVVPVSRKKMPGFLADGSRGPPQLWQPKRHGCRRPEKGPLLQLLAIGLLCSFQRCRLAEFQAVVFGDSPCSLVALAMGSKLDKVLISLFTVVV